ncbi:amino acid permease [Microbacterium terricola]|uniref:Amino acid ABC transporter permease n=1 Tax=Microbacterium terricola TaxID=344163 RepID=A0ABM8DVD0_9MICO|nr:amino acid permease [Microbacterium terricola]UYK39691.1 amino acid permease [Microbacterium terricola]BDV29565.1 amino acid ABC transporter permease [Microbacterium terricola]
MSESKTVSGVTYTHAGADYFEKRQLKRSAGVWGLWGLGIAAVVSGDFSGWNVGLGTTGWGAMLIGTLLITVMFFTMIFSIGEMSAAMPHTGGAYSFSRAALGPWGGFVTGFAETIEYVVTTAVIVWFSGVYADSALSALTGVSLPNWLWWIILYVVFIGLNSMGASIGFRFALVVALISIGVILFFAISALVTGSVDFSRLFDIAPTEGNTEFLPFGGIGILFALPFAIWFFLGIEELPLAAEESHTPAKDIPKAGVWGVVTLTITGLLVLFLNPAVTGTAAITVSPGDGDEPLLAGFRVFMPESAAAVLALFALVGLLASLQGIMFAYGRNMYSLSRAGYYPKFLSLTSARYQTPWVALLVGGVIGYLILTFVLIVLPSLDADAAGSATGVILFIAVFGAVISYMMQMVSFIVLRRKFPDARRPYRSPTGVWGAAVAFVLAFGAFLGIVLNSVFATAVITFLVVFVLGILFFALWGRTRLVLSPEEEYALSGGAHGDPQSEGYDAMEGEVFGDKPAQ